jgi:thymidylate synthase
MSTYKLEEHEGYIKANSVDQQYCDLLRDIKNKGVRKHDRTGTGTKSVFGRQLRFDMKEGFPLLTSKSMYTKGIIVELLWFLGKHMVVDRYRKLGRTNIRYLLDNNCHIWVGDAYKRYKTKCDLEVSDVVNWTYTFPGSHVARHFTKPEFITLIKGDDDFARAWGELGPVYGEQWCDWGGNKAIPYGVELLCDAPITLEILQSALLLENDACTTEHQQTMASQGTHGINQIAKLIEDLENNPDSRRLMVTAWNPSDLEASVLPPCHHGFQCYTAVMTDWERYAYMEVNDPEAYKFMRARMWKKPGDFTRFMNLMRVPSRKLSLMWNQRSVDTPLGLPFNIASYGFLLHMLAEMANMVPGELVGNLGDTHIYDNQWDGVELQLTNETFPLPKLKIKESLVRKSITDFSIEDFEIVDYRSAPLVHYPLSN